MRHSVLALAALFLTSCGYIGDPLPPLANIPGPVEDLAAVQRGGTLIAHFTIPPLTTEQKPVPRPITLDLRIGTNPSDHFDANEWSSHARHIVTPVINGPLATYQIPAADWVGKEVLIAVRVTAANGKQNNWSNIVILPVVAPPPVPQAVTPTATAQGVRVTWSAPAGNFRVFRKEESGEYALASTVQKTEWVDAATEFGKHYSYLIQTIVPVDNSRFAESELSAEASITPVDTFPPAVPSGLRGDPAPSSIELAWNRSPEPDLAGYRIYRAVGNGAFERLAEVSQLPAYSDRAVEPAKTYRYAISAFDHSGNESPRSAPVEAALR